MNPLVVKGLIVTSVIGGAGGSYGLYYGINSHRKVSQEINKPLLTNHSTDEAWKQHLEAYKASQDKWLGEVSDEATWITSMKKWCNDSLNIYWSNSKFNELSEKTGKWCVDTENIKTRVKRTKDSNKSLISDTGTDDEWKAGWRAYNSGKQNKEITEISGTEDPGWKELKKFCLETESMHASSNETLKERYKEFCTKTG